MDKTHSFAVAGPRLGEHEEVWSVIAGYACAAGKSVLSSSGRGLPPRPYPRLPHGLSSVTFRPMLAAGCPYRPARVRSRSSASSANARVSASPEISLANEAA